MNDGERTGVAIKLAKGKRLMYKQPLRKVHTSEKEFFLTEADFLSS
jgi:hypothetical protein